jgi:hypothetical protein
MTPTSDRFQELEACHGRLLSWCDLLEAVADFLPCRVDERFCEAVGRELLPLIDTTQMIEEQAICVALSLIMTDAERADAEERRRAARISRSGMAREVVDALTGLKAGRCTLSWDALSYIIRSFTGAMRGHIRAKREIVARIRSAPAQRTEISDRRGTTAA